MDNAKREGLNRHFTETEIVKVLAFGVALITMDFVAKLINLILKKKSNQKAREQ